MTCIRVGLNLFALACMAPHEHGSGGTSKVITFAVANAERQLKLPTNISASNVGKVLVTALTEMKGDAEAVMAVTLNTIPTWDDAQLACLSLVGAEAAALTKHGTQLLGVASLFAHYGRPFNYSDVLATTDELYGKAMVTAMVYKTTDDLKARGFLEDLGRSADPESGRSVSYYQITDAGRDALRGAVLNSCILERAQTNAA